MSRYFLPDLRPLLTTPPSSSSRKEEAESRPKCEFVPKTLQDLNIEQICSSTEGINGGRFAQPESNFNRARNSKNSLYSSQQNLSQRSGSTASNFSRSKFYGSQQNLQTSSKMSVAATTSAGLDQNRNSVNGYDANAIDPWLNAWDSPTAIQPPPTAAPRQNHSSSQSAAQFRMPGPPASNGFRGSGGGGGGQSNLNLLNNNFVNSSSGSNGLGNGGRQYGSTALRTQNSHYSSTNSTSANNMNNNNNFSDPWSGDSLFPFYDFCTTTFCFLVFG